ncbi:hypothetical protein [Ferroplasma sp.]|uniref:hypothetical protein n=1 Tax=Ferroplasma sp. TaxID=2591003 RepID=UPI00307DA46B
MNTDDQREVICGGDPENYLKAFLKGLYFDLDDNEEIKVIFSPEKFPFNREKFEEMARAAKLSLIDYSETEKEKDIILRK